MTITSIHKRAAADFRVQSAEAEFARLKTLDVRMVDEQVVVEGPLKLFRFADPDGNVLELFSLAQAASPALNQ